MYKHYVFLKYGLSIIFNVYTEHYYVKLCLSLWFDFFTTNTKFNYKCMNLN